MDQSPSETRATLRELAHSLDCLISDEVQTLTGWSDSTLSAYRKRGIGPSYIRSGKHYLYPRAGITAFMAHHTRERVNVVKGLL